ncbi:MAG: hypothetical protein J6T41_00810 [Neisseriaceae bacterium]|nr:hypothetical protein [Neisseriaceae bacterium]
MTIVKSYAISLLRRTNLLVNFRQPETLPTAMQTVMKQRSTNEVKLNHGVRNFPHYKER